MNRLLRGATKTSYLPGQAALFLRGDRTEPRSPARSGLEDENHVHLEGQITTRGLQPSSRTPVYVNGKPCGQSGRSPDSVREAGPENLVIACRRLVLPGIRGPEPTAESRSREKSRRPDVLRSSARRPKTKTCGAGQSGASPSSLQQRHRRRRPGRQRLRGCTADLQQERRFLTARATASRRAGDDAAGHRYTSGSRSALRGGLVPRRCSGPSSTRWTGAREATT